MVIELESMGRHVKSEVSVPIFFKDHKIDDEDFRIDLLVDDTVIVELKSVEKVKNVHKKQLLTYLKLAKKPLGLLINFNVPVLKDGIKRLVN